MRSTAIHNLTRGTVLATAARVADTPWTLLIGLIGQRHLPAGTGLILPDTTWLHTCFMAMPIDIVFYGRSGHVLTVVDSLRPWRLSPISWRACGAIELPAGTARGSGTRPGDLLRFDAAVLPTASWEPAGPTSSPRGETPPSRDLAPACGPLRAPRSRAAGTQGRM